MECAIYLTTRFCLWRSQICRPMSFKMYCWSKLIRSTARYCRLLNHKTSWTCRSWVTCSRGGTSRRRLRFRRPTRTACAASGPSRSAHTLRKNCNSCIECTNKMSTGMRAFKFLNASIIVGRTRAASSRATGASGRTRDLVCSSGRLLPRHVAYLIVRASILYQMGR